MKLPQTNKKLGQHYLHEKRVITEITTPPKGPIKSIIEIGPGPATLTKDLTNFNLPFLVVEKDKRFSPYLDSLVKEENLIWGDCLETSIQQEIFKFSQKFSHSWLVSNLPYNMASQLIVSFLKIPHIFYMTIMMQLEMGEKILLKDKKKKNYSGMNSLGALVQNYFQVEKVFKVSAGSFTPPPKVESIVISLCRKESPRIPLDNFPAYERFLRKLFKFKRKQMGTILKNEFHHPDPQMALSGIKKSPTDRAETLSLKDIQELFSSLNSPH